MPTGRVLWLAVLCIGLVMAPVSPGWAATSPGSHAKASNPADTRSKYSSLVTVDVSATGKQVPAGLMGVDGPLQSSEVSPMASIGVKWNRVETNFEGKVGATPVYNCSNGVFDPIALDKALYTAEQAGATPEVVVDYSPPCLSSTQGSSPQPQYGVPDLGNNKGDWDQLVAEMALHEITTQGVHYFSVWNEPDSYHWQGTPTQFFAFYADTVYALQQAAKAAKQTIQIGGPDFTSMSGSAEALWLDQFLGYVDSNNVELDFLDWHVFPDFPNSGPTPDNPQGNCTESSGANNQPCWYKPSFTVSDFATGLSSVQSALSQHPNLHPDLWVDAWNADEGFDQRENGPFGSAFAIASLVNALNSGLTHMSFYNDMDADATSSSSGLLGPNLAPKPVYLAMRDWRQLVEGAPVSVTVTGASRMSGPKMQPVVSAVASKSANGSVYILLSNFVPYDATGNYGAVGPTPETTSVALEVEGMPLAQHLLSVSSIDYQHSNSQVSKSTLSLNPLTASLDVPENSVVVVQIKQGKRIASPSVASGRSANADDVLILGAIAGGVVYWLWVRSKNKQRRQAARWG